MRALAIRHALRTGGDAPNLPFVLDGAVGDGVARAYAADLAESGRAGANERLQAALAPNLAFLAEIFATVPPVDYVPFPTLLREHIKTASRG